MKSNAFYDFITTLRGTPSACINVSLIVNINSSLAYVMSGNEHAFLAFLITNYNSTKQEENFKCNYQFV